MFNVLNKKQMYNTVFTGQDIDSEDLDCIISMFVIKFYYLFLFGYACFMCRLS